MSTFVFRLKAPRPTFALDMSEEEREIMTRHAEHWRPRVESGQRPEGLRCRARDSARSLTGRIAFDRYSEVPWLRGKVDGRSVGCEEVDDVETLHRARRVVGRVYAYPRRASVRG